MGWNEWNMWIRMFNIRIIRLLGIRIEYLIVGMIGLCGSGYSIVGIVVLGRFKMNI